MKHKAMNSMHRLMIYIVCLSLPAFLVVDSSIGAQGWDECSDLKKFIEATNPEHSSWGDLYRLFKTYKGCDDGIYAEGYSDFIARRLTEHWDSLKELAALTSKDEAFKTFVLQHIDAYVDSYAPALLFKAENECPATCTQLCSDIAKTARSALDPIE